MSYTIKATDFFISQISQLNEKDKQLIKNKIELIKQNPYRNKRIHSKNFSKIFRVRLSISNKDMRLIYTILEPNIILVCLLERKNDYRDLEKYLNDL